MKILFITILLPYPIDCGAKYKTYHVLRLLSKENEIDLVSLVDDYNEKVYSLELKKYCRTCKIFFSPIISYKNKNLIFKLFLSIFQMKPYIVYKYFSKEMEKYINEMTFRKNYDLVYIDHINMAQYIPSFFQGKIIYDEHNISSQAFSVYSKNENHPLLKLIYFLESWKLNIFEKKYIHKFDHIFTISELDMKRLLGKKLKPDKVSYLPVPFSSLNLYSFNDSDPTISFVGLLSWMPNFKGITWFIKEVYPYIKRSIPTVRLKIVGKSGNKLMKFLNQISDKHITYEGFLENLDDLYRKTAVAIIPIREGGGIRIKLLDALSHGIPVVSTTLGAEGIPVVPGKDILIADEPQGFAEAVISVIKNREKAKNLSGNGFTLIKKDYGEKETRKILNQQLDKLERLIRH